MGALHHVVAGVFAALLDPFDRLPPVIGLTLISAVSGLLLLLGFRVASRPAAIATAKRQVQGHLLAVRLYRNDLTVVFRAQRSLLHALAVYLGHMVLPFLVLLVPFAILFAHLDARYGTRALHPGERTIVKAILAPETPAGWRLEGAAGIAVDSVPVRIRARDEIDWRIRATAPGRYEIALVNGERRVEKEVRVTAEETGAAPLRSLPSLAALFVAPTEAPIDPGGDLERVEIVYPPLQLSVLGWHAHWIVIFLIASAAVALLLRKRAGVEF